MTLCRADVDCVRWRYGCTAKPVLTWCSGLGTLGGMAWTTPRQDPERSRRRQQLLAELAGARAVRQRERPQRRRTEQLRQLIAMRRRVAG
ncbi:hypothetical protein D7223_22580 [Micromonospora endolithica]|uniref:Uncharacterized protein n=2 Tax=Micromonospora endolithica TaxID=230091 RepID=A0A3A9Z3H1_9ACTN|nr:hypothetical protein D7223_22580 [Micromonospora endolithica]